MTERITNAPSEIDRLLATAAGMPARVGRLQEATVRATEEETRLLVRIARGLADVLPYLRLPAVPPERMPPGADALVALAAEPLDEGNVQVVAIGRTGDLYTLVVRGEVSDASAQMVGVPPRAWEDLLAPADVHPHVPAVVRPWDATHAKTPRTWPMYLLRAILHAAREMEQTLEGWESSMQERLASLGLD